MNKGQTLLRIISMIPALVLMTFAFTTSYASLTCCKGRGGVARCDHVKGYEVCRDGKLSKVCPCGNYSLKSAKMSTNS
jgi:hypothetical protein